MQNYYNNESTLSQMAPSTPSNIGEQDKKLTFDQALEQVGSSHFYQKRAFVYFGFQWLFASWILFAPLYIFAAPHVDCQNNAGCLVECKDTNSERCHLFICSDKQVSMPLLSKNSLITEFNDLLCENESLGTTLKAMVSIGSLIGFFFFSFIADNYGRKLGLGSSWLCASIGAVILASSQNFTMVGIGLFLLGFGINPSITIQYSLINEHTLGKFRDIQNIGVQIFYGIGETLIVLIAYYFKEWRMLAIFWFCIPLILMNFGIKFIYESPKFIYSKNKQNSIKILNQIAKVNKREAIQDNQLESSKSEQNNRVYTILDLLKYRSINVLFICAFLTFCTIQCVYYGINFAMESIGLNLYINALIIGIFETLAFVIADNLIYKLQRRKTIIIGLIFSGILLLLFMLLKIPKECVDICTMKIVQIGFAGLIRFVICFVMATMYTYMSELFPTVVRSLAVGLISAGGTIGSAAAPFILQASSNNEFIGNPLIVFGIISLLGCLAVFPLHETWNQHLPDDIEEDLKKHQQVQDIDQDIKENQSPELSQDLLFSYDELNLSSNQPSIQDQIAN